MQFSRSFIAVAALFLGSAVAHPGHDVQKEALARSEFIQSVARTDLSHCASKLKARGSTDRAVQRRAEKVAKIRKERGFVDDAPYLSRRANSTPHYSDSGYGIFTSPDVIFSTEGSCVLQPETTEGPYYVSGEYIRQNVIEEQTGVGLDIEIQILDIETCEPIENAYVDFWHCNATGVYGGVIASGNGDSSDESNLQAKWLRGIQPTQYDGVANFQTIFPGHYTGRTPHIHIMVHLNGTAEANATYIGGTENHVGQLFFDQDLITEVELNEPYASNTQELTTNDEDSILQGEAATSDPIIEYTLIGSDVADGLFGWIAVGINTTYTTTANEASSCYADGCVANSNGGGSGGGPGGSSPSGFPSGVYPSGGSFPTGVLNF